MTRPGRILLAAVALLPVLWGLGHLLLQVQLPERNGLRGAFPEPMDPALSLGAVFDTLPALGRDQARLRLLDGNAEAWAERWRLLAGAERRLDVAYFILKPDVFGAAFLGHLLHKARQGVRIRVLLDAMGTEMARSFQGNDYLDALVNAGGTDVRMYRPLRYRYLDAFLTLRLAAIVASEHDKILLADGLRALVGGRNISAEYFAPPQDDATAFHDTDLALSGRAVGAALEEAFAIEYQGGEAHPVKREALDLVHAGDDLRLAYEAMDAWLHGHAPAAATQRAIGERGLPWLEQLQRLPHLRGALDAARPPLDRAPVAVLDSRVRLVASDDPISRSLIRLVRSAEREVVIQSPYLVLPEEAVAVLAEAAARGVAIRILTNSPLSTDNPMSQGFFLEQWPRLLARVPALHLYVAGDRHNLHGKLAVIDGRLALVGTYNLDPMSIAVNSELVVAVSSEGFAARVRAGPLRRIAAGAPTVYRYRIATDTDGTPRLNDDGEPEVLFGPHQHGDPAQWPAVARWRRIVRWGHRVPGLLPVL